MTFRHVPNHARRILNAMRSPVVLPTFEAVIAAFHNPWLEPPPPPVSIGQGATSALRAAMARFSAGAAHVNRRAEVVESVESVDFTMVRLAAFEIAHRILDGRVSIDAVAGLAFRVPVETMLAVFGAVGDPSALLADTHAIVEVIGRGVPASERSDAATIRLLDPCSGGRFCPPVVASLLYQTFDATAALVIETILARDRHGVRAAAVTRTVRVAATDVTIGDVTVSGGDTVVLELGATGLEFGAGPHECPGRSIAEAIVDGIINAIDLAGFDVVDMSFTVDLHGRPTSITIGARS